MTSAKRVKVAIVDSGIDATHPAVGGIARAVAIRQAGALPESEPTYVPGPHADEAGHGTACAALVRRTAPDCELYSVKVLGPHCSGRSEALIAGLRWAIDQRVDVCNLSLGTLKPAAAAALQELADEAAFRRIVLVAAANNRGVPSYPAACRSVISVAAHAVPDPLSVRGGRFPPAEFLAWGIDVPVAVPGGGWGIASGNSLAAAHVTGIVARIRSTQPGLHGAPLKALLRGMGGLRSA